MATHPAGDPRISGNNQTVGSVADIDDASNFEDLNGDADLTNRGVNPGDSGGAANDGGDPENEDPGFFDADPENSAPSSFGDDPNDAFDSEAPTG